VKICPQVLIETFINFIFLISRPFNVKLFFKYLVPSMSSYFLNISSLQCQVIVDLWQSKCKVIFKYISWVNKEDRTNMLMFLLFKKTINIQMFIILMKLEKSCDTKIITFRIMQHHLIWFQCTTFLIFYFLRHYVCM
jgi:hypothetical protein